MHIDANDVDIAIIENVVGKKVNEK